MNPETKSKLADLLTARDVFTSTTTNGRDEEFFLSYHALEAFGVVIILESYEDFMSFEREFLVYDDGQLRDATTVEDELLRASDNDDALLERDDLDFIVCRNNDNTVRRWNDAPDLATVTTAGDEVTE